MVVSYTIRQEQDRSAETAPLIEESIQKVLDVSEEISSLDFYQTLFKNALTESFTDLADSPDAAAFSRKCRSADCWYARYQCQDLYGGAKRLSFRHKCTFRYGRPERYFSISRPGPGNLLVRYFPRKPRFPAFLSFLLSWYKGTKGIWGSGIYHPCFRDL